MPVKSNRQTPLSTTARRVCARSGLNSSARVKPPLIDKVPRGGVQEESCRRSRGRAAGLLGQGSQGEADDQAAQDHEPRAGCKR